MGAEGSLWRLANAGHALLLVDHGSRRKEANEALFDMIELLRRRAPPGIIIHGAHMEMAEPTLDDGFRACVEAGARHIVVVPYFLAPGRHSTTDIPNMAAEAASKHAHVTYTVTAPLGVHESIGNVVIERAMEAMGLDALRERD
jgi:sirohydrochlorin ferrochelatase